MGKNKAKPKKDALKVVAGKSTKLKSKARPVNSQLKRINVQNKSKITEIDKQLVELQSKVRHRKTDKIKTAKSPGNPKPISTNETDYLNLQKKSQETLNELNQMQLS